MPAYSKNVELINKYGYENIQNIAASAKKEGADVYTLDRVIEGLDLDEMADITQIMPLCEEAKDVLGYSETHIFYKTHDSEEKLHFFLYEKGDVHMGLLLGEAGTKENAVDVLKEENIKVRTLYNIFHLVKGNLTPANGNSGNGSESQQELGRLPPNYTNLDKEHLFSGAYTDRSGNSRDDPMFKLTGVDTEKDPDEELEELHLGL
jgi:hypothetical protein